MATYGRLMVNSGLEGIVAATTRLSHVDGERGELVIAGYPVGELAEHATFEETTWLLWHGELPSAAQLEAFRAELAAARALPPATIDVAARMRARRSRSDGRPARRRRHDLAARRRRRAAIVALHSRRSSPRTGGCGAGGSRSPRGRIWVMRRTSSTC